MENTYWIRYSDYETVKDERNMDCIKPAPDAVPIAYDPAAHLGENVAVLVNIALDDKDISERSMKFVRRFGLLGLALEEDYYLTLPEKKADMSEPVFAATGRTDPAYAGVFSPAYSEKAANISAWLDWITVLYNRAQSARNGRMVGEAFAAVNLQTMLESGLRQALGEGTVKNCASCGKVFYSADPASAACSEHCRINYENMKHLQWLKEHFHGKPVSGA